MKKLIVFGDSFAEFKPGICENQWVILLAKKLNIDFKNIRNFALGGTNIEFSIHALFKYINSASYSQEDIILFVTTSDSRLSLLHESINPEWAGCYNAFLSGKLSENHPAFAMYEKDRDFYEKLFFYNNVKFKMSYRALVALALKSLPNQAIIISAFKNVDNGLSSERKFLLDSTENFLYINADLYQTSINEHMGIDHYELYDFFCHDPRENHMCYSNHIILSDQIYECFINKSNKFYNVNKFKSNIININNVNEPLWNQEFRKSWKSLKNRENLVLKYKGNK